MEQSRISPLRTLILENTGVEPLEQLSLEITLLTDLGEPSLVELPTLHGGDILNQSKHPVSLPIGHLEQLVEDRPIELRCRVLQAGKTLLQEVRSLRLLAYNTLRWALAPGGDPAEAYACFDTPNHPVIAQVLKETSHTLASLGQDPALEGYQRANPQRVEQMTTALYLTLGRLGISYINPPAGTSSEGQRIRLADQVLREGLAPVRISPPWPQPVWSKSVSIPCWSAFSTMPCPVYSSVKRARPSSGPFWMTGARFNN